jgi:catechol 2,3-dioxygenase-like lactoylglutathione lyase family enzyme
MFARAPGFAAAEPQLFVADIQASCDFLTHKLGFAVVFVYGERRSTDR